MRNLINLTIQSFLLTFTFSSFAIDPTPGTGFYEPAQTCPESRSTSNSNSFFNSFFKSYVKSNSQSLGHYRTDNCKESINEEFSHGTCKDGSVSFEQPGSEGYFKQEGLCGQVGISNLYNNYCSWNIDVQTVDEHYARDFTPGTRTGVLVDGVNELFRNNSDCPSGEFEDFYAKDEQDYIASVLSATHQSVGENQLVRTDSRGRRVKRAPAMVLISLPTGKELHWVTVVDVEFKNGGCYFIVNSWDDQMTVPCSVMASWSRDVDRKFPGVPGISKYTIVQFNKN